MFSNISLITLEDLMNEWFLNHASFIKVLDVTEIKCTEIPSFIVRYQIEEKRIIKNKIAFKTVVNINRKAKGK